MLGSAFMSWSQCETDVSANDTTICIGDSVTLTATGPPTFLTTTFVGGNNHRGNMFDIVAINAVTIESFDAHPVANTNYEIYYKVGTFVGSEANAAAWTQIGTATSVIAQPLGTPTPIPISVGVTIPAGQTYAFYVTSTNTAVSQNYTDGTGVGNVYSSDANIQFLEGAGMEYPFTAGGGTFTPRVWNGNIHYSTGVGTTFLWGNGATTDQITETPSVQTTYYVDITPSGCPTITDSVTIYMNPQPALDLGADTSACPGTAINLDAGSGMTSYSWNNGVSTAQTFTGFPGASYFVEVTNADGCIAYDTISIAAGTVPIVDLGQDTSICEGTLLTVDAGNVGSTYDWNTTETSQSIVVGAGTYSVIVTSTDGCVDSSGIVITENPMPSINVGNDLTICVNQFVLLDAGAGFDGYLWSTSETTQSIQFEGATAGVGQHAVTVEITDNLGCTNSDTIIVTVDGCIGVNQLEAIHMQVYPNPTSNNVQVELDQITSHATLTLYSTNGTLILSQDMEGKSHILELDALATGTYLLELQTVEFREIIHLIKE